MLNQRLLLRLRSRAAHVVASGLLLAAATLVPAGARAMCDVIPGVTQQYRGALGALNRPYAIPGDNGEFITIVLERGAGDCDAGSAGFSLLWRRVPLPPPSLSHCFDSVILIQAWIRTCPEVSGT